MKVAKIKISFFTLIWRDSPFSRATLKCDFTVQCQSVHVVNLKQKVAAEFLSSNSPCCRSVRTTRNGLFLRVEYDCFKIFFPTVALPPLLLVLLIVNINCKTHKPSDCISQPCFLRLQSYLIIEVPIISLNTVDDYLFQMCSSS